MVVAMVTLGRWIGAFHGLNVRWSWWTRRQAWIVEWEWSLIGRPIESRTPDEKGKKNEEVLDFSRQQCSWIQYIR